jgi:hypothetical protein
MIVCEMVQKHAYETLKIPVSAIRGTTYHCFTFIPGLLAAGAHHSHMRDLPVVGGERLTCVVMQSDHRSFRSDRIEAKAFLRATKLQIEYCLSHVYPPKPLVSHDIMWAIQVEIKR